MLARFAGLTGTAPLTDWEEVAPWAREAAAAVVAAGLMDAEEGRFRPNETMTRAEGEAILTRLG